MVVCGSYMFELSVIKDMKKKKVNFINCMVNSVVAAFG